MGLLKAAIVGCGTVHETHVKALLEQKEVVIHTFCDIKEDRAVNSAKKYNAVSSTNYNEIINNRDIDVVHICTPHYLHAPMAIDALRKGKHVLLEKPMAMNGKEAEEVVKVAEESDGQIGICFQNRYNSTSLKIKELLASRRLGKVLNARAFITWKRDENYYKSSDWRGKWSTEGGGLLINQAIHTLDLLQWFLGEIDFISGNACTRKLNGIIEVEDTAEAYIKFKNGATALFFGSNCYSANAPILIDLSCENATIRLENGLSIIWNDGNHEKYGECNIKTGEKSYWGLGHTLLISDFYNCIKENRRFNISPKEAIRSNQIIDCIYNK